MANNIEKKGILKDKKTLIGIAAAIVVGVCLIALAIFGAGEAYEEYQTPVAGKLHLKSTELAYNVDFNALKERVNSDITSWLVVPGTNVNYPVLRPSDDKDTDFYLRRGYKGESLQGGSIYMQKRNAEDYSSKDTVVYGHNMWAGSHAGSMFNTLHNYESKEFFDAHPYMFVYTPEKTLVYRIFSAYHNDDRLILDVNNDFKSDQIFMSYVNQMQTPGGRTYNCNPEVKVSADDKLLTLSTCIRSDSYGRLLVIGKLLTEEEMSELDETTLKEVKKTAGKGANSLLLRYPPD